jgi:hypothetical protein
MPTRNQAPAERLQGVRDDLLPAQLLASVNNAADTAGNPFKEAMRVEMSSLCLLDQNRLVRAKYTP